jgi:hypothetical protein
LSTVVDSKAELTCLTVVQVVEQAKDGTLSVVQLTTWELRPMPPKRGVGLRDVEELVQSLFMELLDTLGRCSVSHGLACSAGYAVEAAA